MALHFKVLDHIEMFFIPVVLEMYIHTVQRMMADLQVEKTSIGTIGCTYQHCNTQHQHKDEALEVVLGKDENY